MQDNQDKFGGEILSVLDDNSWIWNFIKNSLESSNLGFLKLPSNVPIRASWHRFKNAPRIIIHWESLTRSGGAVIEEILDIDKKFDVASRIIILTTNPTREDVVYFSELNIKRVIQLRNTEKHLQQSTAELIRHIQHAPDKSDLEAKWRILLRHIDLNSDKIVEEATNKIEALFQTLRENEPTSARALDVQASLHYFKGHNETAYDTWQKSIEKNASYYRAYNNLIQFLQKTERFEEAFALMKKMQELNKSNISRLVAMGEAQVSLGDDKKAEHYFNSALDRDAYCADALNGMAHIRFRQGDLEESRKLLAKSHLAEKAASKLNRAGIEMVKKERYSEALEHYTKAQYVLPQQEKGPMLFYNIGLCYHRWGKPEMAKEFLNIALIKDPNYEKAKKLLEVVTMNAAS